MADARDNLPAYINTFNRAKGFQRLAAHYDRFLTSNEINVIQDIDADRVKQIADAFWRDGSLVSGGAIVLGPIVNATVEARLAAAKVYIRGAVHDIEARNLVVSAVGTIVIGIRLRTYTLTFEDDVTLKGMAPGTRAQGEPGASALVMKGRWGFEGDGEEGDFFPIHTITDGTIDTPGEPGIDDAWANLLARYDREAHGGYVVDGFKVQALGMDAGKQVFTVSEGTINVYGYKRTRPASYRLRVTENPEIILIDDEPHAVNSGAQTIVVRFAPIAEIVECTIIAEKTVTLTHGAYTGVSDALPDPTVLSISDVRQGGTVYTQTTDYKLAGAAIDWSPTGAEMAPGSTYQITYRYLTNAVPTNIQRDRFNITGAADGTVAYVKYRTKLPRYDAVVVDQAGVISYLEGISSLYAPQVVQVAPTLVKLADVFNNWGLVPTVRQVGTVRMPYSDLRSLEGMVGDLYALVAEERLQRDVDRKEVTAKRGVFVDPLLDDDMRDQGITQTGAIFSGKLWLPITPTVTTLPVAPTTLSYTSENVFEQRQITGETKINPYSSFGPPPTDVTLNPSVDLWTETRDVWTSIQTARQVGWGGVLWAQTQEFQDRVVSNITTEIETIRQRSVGFTINKWGFNEVLTKVTFDDIDVTPAGVIRADANGTLVSSFQIPAGVPVGVKHVGFEGFGGSKCNALYTAYGWLTTVTNERNVITTNYWYNPDPVAQTFRLQEPRQVLGVDVKFTKIGDRNKPVRIQIREVELGIPTERVVAESVLDMHGVTAIDPLSTAPRLESHWTFAAFDRPTTLREDRNYAITVLTEDAIHSVAIADLGGFDQINGWVTSNAFPLGTFLDGSDARTWLPKPGRSLTFRLRVAKYAPATRTIEVGEVTVTNCSDLMPLLVAERPENTAIEVEFEAPNGAKYVTGPAVNIQLPSAITGTLKVRLRMIGTAALSPLMVPYIQVVAGSIQSEGDYVSRAFEAGTDSKIRVILDVYLPSTSTLTAQVQTSEAAGLPVWSAVTLEKATPLGDGWEERQYMIDHVNSNISRAKVVITGGPAARSNVRNIRCVAVQSTTG
ncbi:DUF4815 domain-containing protein [Bradyrhizobium retamae]|uniref:Virulence-associated protein n=1 Tax=Bradyrhizobium retamae TaxID=1300035 RepID=A0A0R3MU57_9BRAD|nr:DUF4815 domain-containing protein [Bradyrhizobium retamae]KRR21711.1 virulence-associated protein [Bradyrhizobium retamae]